MFGMATRAPRIDPPPYFRPTAPAPVACPADATSISTTNTTIVPTPTFVIVVVVGISHIIPIVIAIVIRAT